MARSADSVSEPRSTRGPLPLWPWGSPEGTSELVQWVRWSCSGSQHLNTFSETPGERNQPWGDVRRERITEQRVPRTGNSPVGKLGCYCAGRILVTAFSLWDLLLNRVSDFFHVFAIKSILWLVHSVHVNTFSDSLTLLGPVAIPFLARAWGVRR